MHFSSYNNIIQSSTLKELIQEVCKYLLCTNYVQPILFDSSNHHTPLDIAVSQTAMLTIHKTPLRVIRLDINQHSLGFCCVPSVYPCTLIPYYLMVLAIPICFDVGQETAYIDSIMESYWLLLAPSCH